MTAHDHQDLRAGEVRIAPPRADDAGLVFIGRIHTPWNERGSCPRRGDPDGPICDIEIFAPFVAALEGIDRFERLEMLYWLHQSRRDLVVQSPGRNGQTHGTFSLRSPIRPNPIGTSIVHLVKRDGARLAVRGLDCLNGTPLLDIKPERCLYTPLATSSGVAVGSG